LLERHHQLCAIVHINLRTVAGVGTFGAVKIKAAGLKAAATEPGNGVTIMQSCEPKIRPSQREKTERALRAYLDLLDAADYMKARAYDQLAFYGVTMRGFRVLELLNRQGSTRATEIARACQWSRQNLDVIVKPLIEDGWVVSELIKTEKAKSDSDEETRTLGRPVAMLRLTDEGMDFIARFLPRHGKVVKAYMRALDGRQQETLSELCRKLREGDVVRFISEMEHEDEEE